MVDNVQVSAGTGTAIAADEVVDGTLGTVKVQMVKIMDGTLDGTTKMKILAASTAPQATDPAVVVSISPNSVNANGSAADSGSAPIAFSTEGKASIGSLTETAPASDTASSGLNGRLQRIAQNITTMISSVLTVRGNTIVQAASSTITRPADTTAYTSGDLVANSTTAGSVAALQFTTLARVSGGSGVIVGAQIQKTSNVVTNAAFRLHLFNTIPTFTSAGDNSAISTVVVASAKGYLGYVDITTMVGFSDVAWGSGAPDNSRGSIPFVATAQIIYGIIEARGAYTPTSGEVFTISLDALQD